MGRPYVLSFTGNPVVLKNEIINVTGIETGHVRALLFGLWSVYAPSRAKLHEACRNIFIRNFDSGVDMGVALCYSNIADKLPVWWNGRHRRLKISR